MDLKRDRRADLAILGHATWAAAAVAALQLADQRGYVMTHRPLIEKRLRKEGWPL